MADQAPQRDFRDTIEAVLVEQAGYARYQVAQREATSGRARDSNRPRPLEFDERGFPIAQRRPTFARRVARLLSPF